MATITSVQSGDWGSPSTWGTTPPTFGDLAVIAAGHTVTITTAIPGVGTETGNALTINGILNIPYTLSVNVEFALLGNIAFGSGGEFRIGTSSNRLPSNITVKLLINTCTAAPAARKFTLTVPNNAKLLWYGAIKTTDTTHSGVTAGTDPTMTVSSATGWQVGDIIILVDETDRAKTQELTIKTGYTPGSTTVPLSGTLTNTKTSGWHVFNVSSNIMVANYNNTYPSYIELIGSGTSPAINMNVLSHVMLIQLGDSTKSALRLGRHVVDGSGDNIVINNYKGYKIEFYDGYGTESINTLQSYLDQNVGFILSGKISISKINSVNPVSDHVTMNNVRFINLSQLNMYGGGGSGLVTSTCMHINVHTLNAIGQNAAAKYAINPSTTSDLRIGTATCKFNTYAVANLNSGNTYIKSLICSDNVSGDIRNAVTGAGGGNLFVESCNLTSTTPITYSTDGGKFCVSNYNGTVGDNRIYTSNAIMQSELTIFRTVAPSLKVSTNNTWALVFPLSGVSRTVYVTSGRTITLNCYSYKSTSSVGAVAKLRISKGTDGHGLSEITEYDILPASTTTWTSQSHSLGTTTSAGFISIDLVVEKGATAFDLYIDDLTFTES